MSIKEEMLPLIPPVLLANAMLVAFWFHHLSKESDFLHICYIFYCRPVHKLQRWIFDLPVASDPL